MNSSACLPSPPASATAVHCFAFFAHPLWFLQLYLTERSFSKLDYELYNRHCLTYIILGVHLHQKKSSLLCLFCPPTIITHYLAPASSLPFLNQNEEKPPCLDSMWVMLWAASPHSIRLSGCQKNFLHCAPPTSSTRAALHCRDIDQPFHGDYL